MNPLPRVVVHYGKHDPLSRKGGVEAFARNLGLIFEEVVFMTRASADFERVRRERLPIICDNHHLRDLPVDIPAIGFQHGVAADKMWVTRSLADARMAWLQRQVARRPNTLWVACAEWIARRFGELHGNRAAHVIYHPVDLQRFDGRLDNADSRLVLHDARSPAKGKALVAWLSEALPEVRFEPLACAPEAVPDRMRRARAFVHLSSYEGNSIVCNEAMASDLPCLFTRVGLMKDAGGPTDVCTIDAAIARRDRGQLVKTAREFLAASADGKLRPRAWVEQNASPSAARQGWARALQDLDALWDEVSARTR